MFSKRTKPKPRERPGICWAGGLLRQLARRVLGAWPHDRFERGRHGPLERFAADLEFGMQCFLSVRVVNDGLRAR